MTTVLKCCLGFIYRYRSPIPSTAFMHKCEGDQLVHSGSHSQNEGQPLQSSLAANKNPTYTPSTSHSQALLDLMYIVDETSFIWKMRQVLYGAALGHPSRFLGSRGDSEGLPDAAISACIMYTLVKACMCPFGRRRTYQKYPYQVLLDKSHIPETTCLLLCLLR